MSTNSKANLPQGQTGPTGPIGSIDNASDVDTTTTTPNSGDVLTWDGSNFIPQSNSGTPVLLQARRTTSYTLTTTLTNLDLDETQYETSAADLNHDAPTNPARLYFNTNGWYFGIAAFEVSNNSNGDQTFTVQAWVNDAGPAEDVYTVVVRKNISLVITRPLEIFVDPIGVPAGSYLTVRVSSTSNTNQVLEANTRVIAFKHQGIQGPQGPQGPAGQSLSWQGPWVSQNYLVDQMVEYNGSSYVCILDTTASQVPTDGTYWDLVAGIGNNIFGTYAENFVDATPFVTTSATDVVAATFTTASLPAGTYRVGMKWNYKMNSTSQRARFKMFVEGSQRENTVNKEAKNTLDEATYVNYTYVTLSGTSARTLELKVNTTGGAQLTVNRVVCEIWKVS